MIIGIVVQKYFCNNLGVYALSYCSINTVISYCKKTNSSIEVRIFTEEPERVCTEVKKVFQYEKVTAFPIIQVRNIKSYLQYSSRTAACDVILDTGLGDGFSDIYSKGRFLLQYFLKRIPEIRRCKTILLPQTIGPYNKPLFEKMAGKIIKKSAVCFTRDEFSYNYAKKIAKSDNVYLTTDMAMRLPKSIDKILLPEGFNVGLNVSGLLYMGGYTKSNQFGLTFEYKEFVEKTIEMLLKKGVIVHLITHVYRNNGEGDEFASKLLAEKYNGVIVAPMFNSPMEAKAYISQLDFFIGSRMHSTIAAISSHIPVCPIGYSRKFNGLFDTIGYDKYVDATKETLEEAIRKVESFIDHRKDIKADVDLAMEKASKLGDMFSSKLETIFNAEL